MTSIKCYKCLELKSLEEFQQSNLNKRTYRCKQCDSLAVLKSRKKRWDILKTQEDCFSYLAYNHYSVKNRKKVYDAEIKSMYFSRQEILELLIEQDFKCALTGISFLHHENKLLRPSIDRIDSKQGYKKENCQIVLLFLNLGKNRYSQENLLECLELLRKGV